MSVDFSRAQRKTRVGQNAVGIIGVSSSRSYWSSLERFVGIMWNAPHAGMNALGYVTNGHTALFARLDGNVVIAAGWDPHSFSETIYQQYLKGLGYQIDVEGGWRSDDGMFDDSSAHTMQVETSAENVKSFQEFLGVLIGTTKLSPHVEVDTHYTFKPGDLEKKYQEVSTTKHHVEYLNCGNAAFVVLCQFLYEWGKRDEAMELAEWVKLGDDLVQNFSQGRVMRLLQNQKK